MPADAGLFSVNWLVLRLHRRAVAAAAAAYARGRLLDVGCGTRPLLAVFTPWVSHYWGVDTGRGRYRATPPQAWASALDLPFAAATFDTVYAAQVLEHVPEPARMVTEMARVLRAGGYLILTAPLMWGVHEEPHDYFRFTGHGLAHLAQQAGLRPVVVQALAGYWVTAGARFCHYLAQFEKLGLRWVLAPVYTAVQLLALALDRLHRIEGDAWNFLLVAAKPPLTGADGIADAR